MAPLPDTDVFAFVSVQRYLERWFARNHEGQPMQLARWLGRELGCSAAQVFNLLRGAKVQPDQVPALARALSLDGDAREHLRRMVALQNATQAELKACLLSVWETHAVHQGIPYAEVSVLHSREDLDGSDEGALLPILALMRAQGVLMEPAAVLALLLAPLDPVRVKLAIDAANTGETLGELLGPRAILVRPPGRPGSLSAAAWLGLLNRTRETLLRTRAVDRSYGLQIWTADVEAERASVDALTRLRQALVRVCEDHASAPIRRIILVQVQQVRLTEQMSREEAPAAPDEPPSRLTVRPPRSRVQGGSPEASEAPVPEDGRPCIYDSIQFHDFAQRWIAWRRRLDKPCSAAWLARAMGVGETLANDLSTGRVRPKPRHVPRLVKAYGLVPEEAHYLEGIARHEQATDPEDKGRERQALLRYAVARGVRTPEGERWRIMAHWGPWAVWALSFLPTFWANPTWVTLTLRGRVPFAEAKDMLISLFNVGLLVPRPEGPPRPAEPKIELAQEDLDLAHFALHDSVFRLLSQEIALPAREQRFLALGLALPDEAGPAVQAALDAYRDELRALGEAAQARADAGESELSTVLLSASQLMPATTRLEASFTPARKRR